MAMAMAADQATRGPPTRAPIANAAAATGSATGDTRRTSARSGSAPATLTLSVPKPDHVDSARGPRDKSDGRERVRRAQQPIDRKPEATTGGDSTDHRRGDLPAGTQPSPDVAALMRGSHGRHSICGSTGSVKGRKESFPQVRGCFLARL